MSKKSGFKLGCLKVLGTLTMGMGAIAFWDIPATAAPKKEPLQLAQVVFYPPQSTINDYYNNPSYYRHRSPRRRGYYRTHGSCKNNRYRHDYRCGYSQQRRKYKPSRGRRVIIINPGNHGNYGHYGNQGSYIRIYGR